MHFYVDVSDAIAKTVEIAHGPVILKDWLYECVSSCNADLPVYQCPTHAATCEFFLSKAGCSATAAKEASLVQTSAHTHSAGALYLGLPLDANESLCVTVADYGEAIVGGWGQTVSASPAPAADRVLFNKTVAAGAAPMVTAPIIYPTPAATLQTWDFWCDAGCASSFMGCTGLNPSCELWLSKGSCNDKPPGVVSLGARYPQQNTHALFSGWVGLPLDQGEMICATVRDSASVTAVGWGTRAPTGVLGDPHAAVVTPDRRVVFNAVARDAREIVAGPATLEDWKSFCDQDCSSGYSGCTGLVPQCKLWLSTASCGADKEDFVFAQNFPLATAHRGEGGRYYGFPLAAGEHLCARGTQSASLTVSGWAFQPKTSTAPCDPAPFRADQRVALNQTVATTTPSPRNEIVIPGPAELSDLSFECDAGCSLGYGGCPASITPKCELWLSKTLSCSDPRSRLATLGTIYPLHFFQDATVYEGTPLGQSESLCVTTADTAIAYIHGMAARVSTSPVEKRVLFDVTAVDAGSGVASAVTGPANLEGLEFDCNDTCDPTVPGFQCGTFTPNCKYWVSQGPCENGVLNVLLGYTFPRGALYDPGLELASFRLGPGFPLKQGEQLCVSVRDRALGGIRGRATGL